MAQLLPDACVAIASDYISGTRGSSEQPRTMGNIQQPKGSLCCHTHGPFLDERPSACHTCCIMVKLSTFLCPSKGCQDLEGKDWVGFILGYPGLDDRMNGSPSLAVEAGEAVQQ